MKKISNLRAVMYSLMMHTIRLLFIKRTSMKDSCWIVYFRSCIVHWCWNAFNVDSTWNSQRYFSFIPQILYFLDSRVILIWQITILPISYTIKILLNLRWIILFSLQYIFQLRLEKRNYDTFTIVLCVQDLYLVIPFIITQ